MQEKNIHDPVAAWGHPQRILAHDRGKRVGRVGLLPGGMGGEALSEDHEIGELRLPFFALVVSLGEPVDSVVLWRWYREAPRGVRENPLQTPLANGLGGDLVLDAEAQEIHRRTGLHRETIRRALAAKRPPAYRRPKAPSKLDPFKEEVERLLRSDHRMPGTRIRELLAELGYEGGKTILDDHLRDGVVIENTYGSVVAGNMIEECAGTAIVLDRDCYGITLSANVIAHETSGGIDLRDIIFFGSLIAFSLFANAAAVELKKGN